jgi:putative ABC transport system permease protein
MDTLLQDLRHALRRLTGMPGFTIGAILSLALGIAASTLTFSAVNGVILRPLPFEQSSRLVFFLRDGENQSSVSIPDVVDWRARSATVESFAAYASGMGYTLTGSGEPVRLNGIVAEPEYFTVLRGRPILGRFYSTEENQPGSEPVAVISEGLWRGRFASDPAIVGRSFRLNDKLRRIVGVVPHGFDFQDLGIEVYAPPATTTPWALTERGSNHLSVIGRLKPGVTLGQARAEMESITRRLLADYPLTNGGKILHPIDLREYLVGDVRRPLLVLLGAVALVVLVTCVNLANALLARATARRQEISVRLALGAARSRLLSQLLSESLLVAVLGGAVGVLLAWWGRAGIAALGPATLPRVAEVHLDWRVLGFSLGLSILCGFVVGLAPALQAWRGAPADALGATRGSSAGRSRNRRLDVLAALQAALALMLAVGAGVLARSFARLERAEIGFDPSRVLVADLSLPAARYGNRALQNVAFGGMVDAARATGGIVDAAYLIGPPLNASRIGHTVLLEDRPHGGNEDGVGARVRPIIGDYFHLLGIPVLSGRALTPADNEGAQRVVVVNRRFSDEVWPGADPLGKRLAFRLGADSLIWRTVVGVVGDVRSTSVAEQDSRAVYLPYYQRDVDWESFGSLLIKTRGAPLEAYRTLQEAVWKVDPTVALENVGSMEQLLSRSVARQRFSADALGLFAVVALLIAMQGLYAVLTYTVALRQREIGIRVALGAERMRIVRLVLGRATLVAGIGLIAGLGGSLAFTAVLKNLLYETAPTDLVAYGIGASLLISTALVASWLPARRAAGVDPVVALRNE